MNKSGLFIALSLLAATGVSLHAQTIVSEQFTIYNDHNLAPTDVAGADAAANWNVLSSGSPGNQSNSHVGLTLSQSGLVDSTDASSNIGFTLDYDSQFQGASSASGTLNKLLYPVYFNRYSDDTPASPDLSLDITGLNTGDTYDLYVYVNSPFGNSGQSSSITVGAKTYNFTTDTSLTSYTQITDSNADGNYVEFTGLTGSASELVTVPTATSGGNANLAGITGFQIVDLGAAATPEPSTYVLLGLGFLGLVVLQGRKLKV